MEATKVKYKWFLLATMILTLIACAGVAHAQYDYYELGPDQTRWNIHAGVGFLSGDTRDDVTWVVGLEYEIPVGDVTRPDNYVTFGADYISIDTLTTGTESVIPILLGYRKYGQIGNSRAYFGVGIGTLWASDNIPELRIDDGFDFGWDVNAGFEFTNAVFLQARYIAGSHPTDDGVTTVEIGYRF